MGFLLFDHILYAGNLAVSIFITDDAAMTSALRREGVTQNMMIVQISCVSGTVTRGEGIKNNKILWTPYVLDPEIILVRGCENVAGKLRQKW